MSDQQIANEVLAALIEVGQETGRGRLTAYLRPAVVGGNPWDAPSSLPEMRPVTVAISSFSRHDMARLQIRAGDKKLLMDATGPRPQPGDTLTVSGMRHRIEAVDPLAPGGFPVMYEVQAREMGPQIITFEIITFDSTNTTFDSTEITFDQEAA